MGVWQTVEGVAAVVAILGSVGTFVALVWRRIKRVLDARRADRERTQTAIADLSIRVEELERAISQVQKRQNVAADAITTLNERTLTLNDRVTTLLDSDERTRKDLSGLKDRVNDVSERFSKLASQFWPKP
jgi:chromosome segregation ATPase